MCISSYKQYLFLSVIIGFLIIFSIFTEKLFYLLPIMVFSIVQSRIKCPHCDNPLLKDKNGWYIFTMRTTCRHCAKNTNTCIELQKEGTNKAKKSQQKKKR